ncbi:hypothetical protein CFOL_v3_33688 [Cephalotus follicularis]|uniref:Putative plant transposon protein domain-containing protein n=1 Tax=Cephalotus follicularis TaxID=3775 RepID=A0A1Q3DCX5_CEPFO|nr:hypothetical protein CFOL_v3_33688 [Cephalotus follicularis]
MGGRNIDLAFCSSEFSFVSWLEDLHLIPLVQISDPFYIKLVKEFYTNLRIVSSPNAEFALSSTVKGQRIFLDARILASILHIPHTGLYVFEHKKWPEVEGFHHNQILSILYPNDPNIHPNMALSTNRLSMDHRLLHHLIVHQFLPTGGGYAKLSQMQAFLMWCILSKIEFCFPLLMLKTMARAFTQKKSVLPFGSILTKVFQHNQIRLEGEVATKLKKEDTYNKSTMNRMVGRSKEALGLIAPRLIKGQGLKELKNKRRTLHGKLTKKLNRLKLKDPHPPLIMIGLWSLCDLDLILCKLRLKKNLNKSTRGSLAWKRIM